MTNLPHISRRDFIKLCTRGVFIASGALGIIGLLRYLSYLPEPVPPMEYNLGAPGLFPPGSRTLRSDIPALITNQAGKIQATSLICPHLGCTLQVVEAGEFDCPCHGSRFDTQGRVLAGPAQKSLAQLRVMQLEDGTLKLVSG
jgi:nitrite reductase/ring-hydroxylating ferredoxin subunit